MDPKAKNRRGLPAPNWENGCSFKGSPLPIEATDHLAYLDALDLLALAIETHGLPRTAMGGTWGHSLGLDWGSPWIESISSIVMRPGMCFAIERRIEAPGIGGANYENNVIVTDAGPGIIIPAPDRYAV